MSAKISRTFLLLLCILIILLPMQGKRYSQAFSTIAPYFTPDAEAPESETSELDTAEQYGNGDEASESETSELDTAEQVENGDEASESETSEQVENGDEASESEVSEHDTAEQVENGDEASESEVSEHDTAEQAENDDEASESGHEQEEPPQIQNAEMPRPAESGPVRDSEAEQESGAEIGGEDISAPESLAAVYSLEQNERIVKTFAELKNALSQDNGVTTVHLGSNIIMQEGIEINSGKPHVTIDGLDPTNPEQTEPYTLTDLDAVLFTDTIYLNSSDVSYIHVRDLKITGKNYYGPVGILDAPAMLDVKLIFERVDYNGPQLGYHRQGRMYVIDCQVQLHGGNGTCPVQEFSEAKELVFEGVNTIDSATTTNTVFWHPFGGSFTIADDSSVTLTSPNTSVTYGMYYADGAANKIDIAVGRRSKFNAVILNSAASIGNVTLSSLTVREGGSFSLTTTGTANRSVLSVGGNITVEPEAAFKINSYGGIYAALSLRTGDITVGKNAVFHIISSNTNSSLLNLHGRSFICDDPASILLYNPANRNILASITPGEIYISSEQINYWNTVSQGGLDNPPRYRWKKANGENIRIEGTLAIIGDGNFSSISSNYEAGDLPGTAPDKTSFNMAAARVLAFGRLELMVNTPVTTSVEITGITAPGADVRASFYSQGVNHIMPDVSSDENGVFVIPIDIPLQYLTEITVMSSYQYLTATQTVTVGEGGGISFTTPDELRFYTTALAPKTQIVKRLHADWKLVVSDSRGAGNMWSVYARELQPLTPADLSKPALKNSLVFVEDTGAVTPLGTSAPLLIYRHTAVSDSEMVNISWADERGVLARIPTGAAYADQAYVGVIEWSLTDAP